MAWSVTLLVTLTILVGALAGPYQYNPVANRASVVTWRNARFSFLTNSVVRMEYSPNGVFEDRATMTMMNRYLPAVNVTTSNDGAILHMQTPSIVVSYTYGGIIGDTFSNATLYISSVDGKWRWFGGMKVSSGNLLGTVRTLDRANGPVEIDCAKQPEADLFCTYGMVSRDGWVLVDDTYTTLLLQNPNGWDWVAPRPNTNTSGNVDWYLFMHGLDYRAALYDFTKIALPVPLPPRYMFGSFWSRYWAFNDKGEMDIVRQYEQHDTPLDVMVIDMDWHETFYLEAKEGKKDQAGNTPGWTGWTWDSRLFPRPKEFLTWVHNKNIKVTLNLHPASGVQPHEKRYPEMAKAMGIDPATRKYVPFNITDINFTTNLMDIMLRPLEKEGVDFWWLDWQQWETTDIPNLNPTYMLNYVFTTNNGRRGDSTRPTILHRWGGLGNHKFQLGFSGDVYPSWESLAFQPYFTQTAANVGFMWSHDIGGHNTPVEPELYTRWVQWGAFSPVFRTHCTKQPNNDRRIWVFPFENFQIMRDAISLRLDLVPYIYTAAFHTTQTGLAFLYPMYYDFPSAREAYKFTNQYKFGSLMIVAPIVTPVDKTTGLATTQIWLPDSSQGWVELGSGLRYSGDEIITRTYALSEIPVFIAEGSMIPMLGSGRKDLGAAQEQYSTLRWLVVVGQAENGAGIVYEDNPDNIDYLKGGYAETEASYTIANSIFTATILPASGSYNGMLKSRAFEFEILGLSPASTVSFDGVNIPYAGAWAGQEPPSEPGWWYDGSSLSIKVNLPGQYSTTQSHALSIKLLKYPGFYFQVGYPRCFSRAQTLKDVMDDHFPQVYQEQYPSLLILNEASQNLTTDVSNVVSILSSYDIPNLITNAISEVKSIAALDQDTKSKVAAQLGDCAKHWW